MTRVEWNCYRDESVTQSVTMISCTETDCILLEMFVQSLLLYDLNCAARALSTSWGLLLSED